MRRVAPLQTLAAPRPEPEPRRQVITRQPGQAEQLPARRGAARRVWVPRRRRACVRRAAHASPGPLARTSSLPPGARTHRQDQDPCQGRRVAGAIGLAIAFANGRFAAANLEIPMSLMGRWTPPSRCGQGAAEQTSGDIASTADQLVNPCRQALHYDVTPCGKHAADCYAGECTGSVGRFRGESVPV